MVDEFHWSLSFWPTPLCHPLFEIASILPAFHITFLVLIIHVDQRGSSSPSAPRSFSVTASNWHSFGPLKWRPGLHPKLHREGHPSVIDSSLPHQDAPFHPLLYEL